VEYHSWFEVKMQNLIVKDNISVEGFVTVKEIFSDGTENIINKNENVVVNSGILLLIQYLIGDGEAEPLSGVTHLAIGTGRPDFVGEVTSEDEKRYFLYGLTDLVNEVIRVIRWDVKYKKYDEFNNLVDSEDPTGIIDFSYRLRQQEPEERIYISEIGMFGGDVRINHTPDALPEDVINKGTLFSYKFYDPPIDKFPDTTLEFNWRIKFTRG
jgi:hypothetical protein